MDRNKDYWCDWDWEENPPIKIGIRFKWVDFSEYSKLIIEKYNYYMKHHYIFVDYIYDYNEGKIETEIILKILKKYTKYLSKEINYIKELNELNVKNFIFFIKIKIKGENSKMFINPLKRYSISELSYIPLINKIFNDLNNKHNIQFNFFNSIWKIKKLNKIIKNEKENLIRLTENKINVDIKWEVDIN